MIAALDNGLHRLETNGFFKNDRACLEYYCVAKDVKVDGSEYIIWVALKNDLPLELIAIYADGIDEIQLADLINRIFTAGGDTIYDITFWDNKNYSTEVLSSWSRRAH